MSDSPKLVDPRGQKRGKRPRSAAALEKAAAEAAPRAKRPRKASE